MKLQLGESSERAKAWRFAAVRAGWLIWLLSLAACSVPGESPPPDIADAGYRLVWADEFDQQTCPSPNNWVHEQGFVRNKELQWFQSDNAYCRNGRLILEARRERAPNPRYSGHSDHWQERRRNIEYTSASLKTQGVRSWRYGRIEMRAKIPVKAGIWPVFWTLGTDAQWPAGGEIDIMESYRGLLLANASWAGNAGGRPAWNISRRPVDGLGEDWAESFHTWRLEWTDTSISFFVDNMLLNVVDLRTTINAADLEPRNPFRHPHYLLLTLAVGGSNGGDPSNTGFPVRFEVEYVRVYRDKAAGLQPDVNGRHPH